MTGPFYKFLMGQKLGRVRQWSEAKDYNTEPDVDPEINSLGEADVVQSIRREGGHALLLDIDYPVYLAQSTNGNSHLYIDVPDGLSTTALMEIINVLAKHGVIEEGYAAASERRGYTSLRRPGRRKGRPIPYCWNCGRRGDQIPEYRYMILEARKADHNEAEFIDIQEIEDYIYAEEGTIQPSTGLFTCTYCYVKAATRQEIF